MLQGTPQPAPPVADHPAEIRRDQTQATTADDRKRACSGLPDDAANRAKSSERSRRCESHLLRYLNADETVVTGQWYPFILYRQ